MKPTILLAFVAGVLGLSGSNQPDLADVEAQIEEYLQSLQSSTHESRASRLPSGCSLACSFLNSVDDADVAYAGELGYEAHYWSNQQKSVEPACRVLPSDARAVSFTLLVLRSTNCKFAVRSGGHAADYGASNIAGGVSIDMVKLKELSLSSDEREVVVGSGNRWGDVYAFLRPHNLVVIGGRDAAIGVGGLTLGGGISFLSDQYGWACDNVNSFEIVLADGSIRQVSERSYPDLFFALRGGGNNFGIITRFNLAAYPLGLMWGGWSYHTIDTAPALLNATVNYAFNAPQDIHAGIITNVAYVQETESSLVLVQQAYSKPVIDPPILAEFQTVPYIVSTRRIADMSSFAAEIDISSPPGLRESFWTLTVKADTKLLLDFVAIFEEEIIPVKRVAAFRPVIIFEPMSTTITSKFLKHGGNAVGVTPADGPLMVVCLNFAWSDESDDAAVRGALKSIVTRGNATAWDRGLGNHLQYANYADFTQGAIKSYGPKNVARLKKTSKRYDPTGVFTRLLPGGQKLFT